MQSASDEARRRQVLMKRKLSVHKTHILTFTGDDYNSICPSGRKGLIMWLFLDFLGWFSFKTSDKLMFKIPGLWGGKDFYLFSPTKANKHNFMPFAPPVLLLFAGNKWSCSVFPELQPNTLTGIRTFLKMSPLFVFFLLPRRFYSPTNTINVYNCGQ